MISWYQLPDSDQWIATYQHNERSEIETLAIGSEEEILLAVDNFIEEWR